MTSSEKVNAPARSFCQNTANQALPLNGCHLEVYGQLRHVKQTFSCSSSRTRSNSRFESDTAWRRIAITT